MEGGLVWGVGLQPSPSTLPSGGHPEGPAWGCWGAAARKSTHPLPPVHPAQLCGHPPPTTDLMPTPWGPHDELGDSLLCADRAVLPRPQ